ncbi:flavin reductase family protein [Sphingomonas canadensis]|uniref:Flavin reductase family protein n=1 Tax=Sphingomonas canadensis TaxID=1219257 RepID=A0ABW3H2F6_9SPHN|nr:flavin reductase family protein [Sphingomonas canadensis]MCW3834434.1 flavin reductase family protein [Sphingomonas canadensis]
MATYPAAAGEELVQDFRGAMRRLASGVALVTTADAAGGRYGIAMTAVMSLSMEPPSLLLAVNAGASLCGPLMARGRFGVSILAREDAETCRAFVAAPAASRFDAGTWVTHESGIPLLGTALARIVCTLDKAEPFASHMVIRGIVEYAAVHPSSDALVFLDGRYGGMSADG